LKGFDLDRLAPTDPDFIHIVVECSKLAYADRETYYGDPDFVAVPIEVLLSDDYNDQRRRLVGDRASLDQRPGIIDGYGKRIGVRLAAGERAGVSSSGAGEPTVGRMPWTHDDDAASPARDAEPAFGHTGAAAGDTVHFDIVDAAGNMVS